MRKVIFTMIVGLVAFGSISAQEEVVVFDPNNYDEGVFQGNDAMEIVTVDDAKYLKVELAGWGSTFQVSTTTLDAETDYKMTAEAKYEEGSSGYTVDQVNTFIKLTDLTYQDIAVAAAGSSTEFTNYEKEFTTGSSTIDITVVQLAGQETTDWGAVEGDFIYLGAVKVAEVVGVVDSPISSVKVYPNPASSELNIDLDNAVSAEIYNVVGSRVSTENLNGLRTINVSELPMGVYILKVTDVDNKVYVTKFNKK